jgi:hypothetical protein
MSELYLWDRSGPPDAEIQRLEELLSRYRYRPAGHAPDFNTITIGRSMPRAWAWAAAACVAIAAGTLGHRAYRNHVAATCDVAAVRGTVTVNGSQVSGSTRISPGDRIEVARHSEARIRVGTIGDMVAGPGSLFSAVRFDRVKHFSLHRGAVQANILAQPYVFVIDTPFATAYDLGCAYRLEIDPEGNGRLHVTSGWVMLQNSTTESLVAAGTMAEIRRGQAPGVPVRASAPHSLVEAIATIGFEENAEKRGAALENVLPAASRDDAVMLVNLLWRVNPQDRGAVFDRLAEFYPPPPAVTREAVVAGNWSVLRQWWTGLGFGNVRKLPRRFYVE